MAVNLPFWTYGFGFLFLNGMVAAYDGKFGVLTLLRGNATDDVCLDSNTERAGGSDAAETLPFPLGLASFSLISAANRADLNFFRFTSLVGGSFMRVWLRDAIYSRDLAADRRSGKSP